MGVDEIRNEIKSYIAVSGWSLTDIVKEMNMIRSGDDQTTTQNISNKLTRGTIKYSECKEIARIIGFNIKWHREAIGAFESADDFDQAVKAMLIKVNNGDLGPLEKPANMPRREYNSVLDHIFTYKLVEGYDMAKNAAGNWIGAAIQPRLTRAGLAFIE